MILSSVTGYLHKKIRIINTQIFIDSFEISMEEPQSVDWIAVSHGAVRSSSVEITVLPCINDRFCASNQLKHNGLILIDPSLRKPHSIEKVPLKNFITHFTAKRICSQQISQGFFRLKESARGRK